MEGGLQIALLMNEMAAVTGSGLGKSEKEKEGAREPFCQCLIKEKLQGTKHCLTSALA